MGKEKKNSSRVTKKVSPQAGKQKDARGFPSCNQQARSGENLQIGGRVTGSRGSLEGGQSSGFGGNLQAENRSGSKSKCKDVQQKTKRATSHSQTKLDCVPIWLRQPREIQTESQSEENSDSSDGGSADNSSGMDGDEESDLDPMYAMEEELEQETDGEPTDMEDERTDGLENEPIVPNNLVGQGPKKRVYRRKTRCLNIVGRGLNDRPTIILNDKNQPIGPESHVASLSSYIGTLARNAQLVPLSLKSWKKLPKKEKDDLWKLIQEKFIIDELAKRWVLATVASAWRC
ncbi:uncharacterized protein LOC119980448 isoform X2 [Tripterygium wilfordii]|uniref:uncharacterized protein LOC119980448 isoform X2 n=1 Tax=Tripterygium wilfordii TaxID=458696 RepID=UPI0018F7F65C|nr:uncharacterized protein LOC119980448 isoform X2 [Tripterygium wilfordii]XP_038679094.1 uncharacterized protein LOC119980448 isoform X2 [Tripterygium wilfordii]XP_038679103.1 uncharacterized protein LOC119980448 isoform X2 [Tripterygium wilfordii]